MSEWISTKERMPKRADAGVFRDVAVMPKHLSRQYYKEPYAKMVPFHLVRKREHSYWMPLPPPPE